MTQAVAQACVAAIVGAGFSVEAKSHADGSWTVTAVSTSGTISSVQVDALVAAQGVSATMSRVDFN